MSDAIFSRKLEQKGEGDHFGTADVVYSRMGICVLSRAHGWEMRCSFVYLLIVKYLFHQFFKNQPRYIILEFVEFFGVDFIKYFLRGLSTI